MLSALRKEAMSKAELSRQLGINKVSIGEIIDAMVSEGLLEEKGKSGSGLGRPATIVAIRPNAARALTVEMRRKSVSVSVSDALGRVIRFERLPRNEEIKDILGRTLEKMKGNDSPMTVLSLVNCDENLIDNITLPQIRASRAEAEAVSELMNIEDCQDTLFISWSDSIEAAFFHDGLMPLPEFPHLKVQEEGSCVCGAQGCIDAVASGTVLLSKANTDSYRSLLTEVWGLRVVKEAINPMAVAISLAVQALSAKTVVITGDMSAMPENAFSYLQSLVTSMLPPSRSNLTLINAQSGDKASREGGSILALDEFFYHTRLLTRLSAIEKMDDVSDFLSEK